MLKNYFKTAWRSIRKNRLHAVVNILGLAAGLASFIVILVYLNYELSYDKWDPSLKKVYKISLQQDQDFMQTTPAPLASMLARDYPAVDYATCIQPDEDFALLLDANGKKIYQKGVVTVEDSSFFHVFPYHFSIGSAASALNRPDAIVISEAVCAKLFGKTDPIGKIIRVHDYFNGVVTGVFRKPDGPAHFDAEVVTRDPYQHQNLFWGNYSYLTYIKLKHPLPESRIEKNINSIYYKVRMEGKDQTRYKAEEHRSVLFADRVDTLHNFPRHGESPFKITVVLLVLAVFLLIAGAINFSNLSLARAITRAREVGVRKVLGSGKIDITIQALLEISVQCFISLLLALIMVNIALPYFSRTFNLPLTLMHNSGIISVGLQILAALLAVVLLSGLYPAIFVSRFQPAEVLKGKSAGGGKGVLFRNSLLVVQLTLSAFFVAGIIVINRQINFIEERDLGFNASQVLRITALQSTSENNFAVTRSTLLALPGVEYVAKSTEVPGAQYIDTTTNKFKYDGREYRLSSVKVSADYFSLMDIKLLSGRLFDDHHPEDLNNTAIINETAWRKLGSGDVIGQQIRFPYCDTLPYTIVGVVKDFNVQGMQSSVVPSVYSISNQHCGFQSGNSILVKINTSHTQRTIAAIESAWKKIEPAFPIRYTFVDDDFRSLYAQYIRLRKMVLFFSVISILISVMGLFALTSFLARLRIKEIGVRKVLGASVGNITMLLSGDFVKLVIIAVLIALPAAWWATAEWLNEFAYRINLSYWMFVIAGLLVLGITLATVSLQAVKAAGINPADSLRTE